MPYFFQQAILLVTGLVVLLAALLWSAVQIVATVLGLSSVPDDYNATRTKLESFFRWLLTQDATTASFAMAGLLMALGVFVLGSVEIHREWMTAAASWMMAVKLVSVLSARMAMRLNSLSLQKKFSIR